MDEALIFKLGLPCLLFTAVGVVVNLDFWIIHGKQGCHTVEGCGCLLDLRVGFITEDDAGCASCICPMESDREAGSEE